MPSNPTSNIRPEGSTLEVQYPIPEISTAVLFAGGKSSRMGRDKSLLPFGGYDTLCEYQFQRLQKLFGKVFISTKEQKFGFEAPLILDRYPESSPLIGLLSVFETISEDACFILSVDAPFADEAVITKLYKESKGHTKDLAYDAIIAQSPKGKQPLCGIYRRSIIPYAKALIAEDNHRLNALLQAVNSHFVMFENEAEFENLNHPHEYEAALKTVQSQ